MPILFSGWVVWNAGSPAHPNFVPRQIFPPAVQVAEISERVYASKQAAQSAINAAGGAHSIGAAAAAEKTGPEKAAAVGGVGAAAAGQDVAQGLPQIGDFFSRLTQRNTWLRVGEFGIGVMLLYVGAKAMFPGAVNTVTSPAKKAAKAAIL